MKSILIAATAALVLPLPAAAQSISDTHELVWHPSGKTPAVTYRERARAACVATAGHHQSGKGALPVKKNCAVAAKASTAAVASEPTVAR